MVEETQIIVGDQKLDVFMQDGFFYTIATNSGIHSHRYTEVHVIISGQAEYLADGKTIILQSGDVAFFPGGMFHAGVNRDEDTRRIAFQINWPIDQLYLCQVSQAEAYGLYDAIQSYMTSGKSLKMEIYMALICSNLPSCSHIPPRAVEDRCFLINEFFSHNYDKDISLNDLAVVLSVSPKQASRLVKKYWEVRFRKFCAIIEWMQQKN